ncbi:hypothetical protein D910_04689, partial [Dendroctonus ponderosae]
LPTAGTNDSSFNSPFDLTQSQSVVNHIKSEPYIMLSTAIISVLDRNGKPHSCRVLLDNCSQSNFITSSISIDMLLGASVFWSLICVGQILLPNSGTVLQKTKFGWILSGPLPLNPPNNSICNLSLNSSQYQAIHDQLESFWRLEEFSNTPNLSQEELDCEEHFINTTSRDSSGRFVVHLPQSSTTTKLRVVFDGSVKSSSGISLNDTLKVGPKLQDDLMDLLLNFRTHKVAFTADIEKMYRCVMLNKPDRELHRILFRSSLTDELNHYQLNTVTYGTSCASFLAIRALRQVAIDMKDQYPTVSNTILSHFYVDDLLSGSSSVEEANQTIKDLTRILQSYGFNLRKFVSSSPQVLDNIHGNQSASTNK